MTAADRRAERTGLVLIGMPGVGKTTVGKRLARHLGLPFLDTDHLVQERTGRSIAETITDRGEDGYLRLEEACVCEVPASRYVIATGASVPVSARAMDHLRGHARIIHLELPTDVLQRRLEASPRRAVVWNGATTVADLQSARTALYRRFADATVTPAGRNHDETVARILSALDPSA